MSSELNLIEESFFKLCNFDTYNSIQHNLRNWNINLTNWINKAGQIEVDFIVPYSEMKIELIENFNDFNFFNKPTVRVKISMDQDNKNYIFSEKIKCTFNENIKYILLDSLFIYPHNLYYLYNREYLRNKITFSTDYISGFLESYKLLFNSNIPFIFINKATENHVNYTFEILIKEYLNIYYISTDLETSTIICNLIFDKNYQKEKQIKYKKISLSIPRLIKNTKNKFKFITSNWSN
jgi:hypothetical protein